MRTSPYAASLAAGCPAGRARPKSASAVLGRVAATLRNGVSTICSRAEKTGILGVIPTVARHSGEEAVPEGAARSAEADEPLCRAT